ncbi:MAG TPA: thioredoxin family protein [Nitrosomonas sp.]|nr:thioredoxin family protein [Nitrosomonas sp.]HMW69564.1 thioredoxin family protein [Nitrosomonas sp.]HNC41909.1 thioredoxin family protein [Nitrosomonas sp.]HNM00702.1 thioredoxin family protein [Nitrosomonas sp.]
MKPLFIALMSIVITLSSAAQAAVEKEAFTEARYNELRRSGKVFLVDIYATWCPTCAKQQDILATYGENNPQQNLNVLVVDFDNDKKWVRYFKAPRQSTLLLYSGDEQLWFSVGETRYDVIAGELDKALNTWGI